MAGGGQGITEAGAGGGVRRAAAGQHAADSRGYGVRLSLCSPGAASGFGLLGRSPDDAGRVLAQGEPWGGLGAGSLQDTDI